MGVYFNPGLIDFARSVRSEIYVDKTELIALTNRWLNTDNQYICVSRPRRFGKSMTLNMLAAYYSRGCDSAELFKGLKVENVPSFKEHLNKYNVIFLNIKQILVEADKENIVDYLQKIVLEELSEEYKEFVTKEEKKLIAALRKIYVKTGKQFIFLIDEWDCIIRERQDHEELQKQYLDFLCGLLKDQGYVVLAYMTGILPIKKYGVLSALNMFIEDSMTNQKALEEYTGFTEDEVRTLCIKYNMDFEETSNWYDGYTLKHFKHIYNPKSVVEAMQCSDFESYWTSTETYEALKIYIDMDFNGLRSDIVRMLGGGRVKVDTNSFQNDMHNLKIKDDTLTLLIHLGYLAYNPETKEVFIPNKEIIEEFERAMRINNWEAVIKVTQASDKLLEDTLQGREKNVADGLDQAHTNISSILTYNDEASLACAVRLAYFSAIRDYKLIRELPTGKGFADIVFLPLPNKNKPAIIIELKYNKSANTAIRQIKETQYTQALSDYSGEILLVGINYDKESKKHNCIIEKWNNFDCPLH